MKKIISIVLAFAMIAAFSVTAFAANVQNVPASETGDVEVKIDATSVDSIETVYYVDIEWEALEFTYTFDGTEKNTWDPETHTYTEANDGNANWDKTSIADAITVTNHSNEAISVAATDSVTLNGVTATTTADFDLPSAVGYAVDAAEITNTFDVSVAGVPTIEEGFTIGTITVEISAK